MILTLILTVAKSIPLRFKWVALKLDTRRRCDVSTVIGSSLALKVADLRCSGSDAPTAPVTAHHTAENQ
jgi:hypothetical protein